MKRINNGFGNLISAEHTISSVRPECAPIKRMIQDLREKGVLIDASFGRSTRAVILMDSGHGVLSALTPEILFQRFEDKTEEDIKENE